MRQFVFRAGVCLCAVLPFAAAEDIGPRVGVVEVYGARKISPEKIKNALGIQVGAPMPPSKADLEDRLQTVPGVIASRLQATCCDQGKMVVYVGIAERNSPYVPFRDSPAGDAVLPQAIVENYHAFLDAVDESIRLRQTTEDLTNGYSLMRNNACRDLQQQFIPLVADHLAEIDKVVRDSKDEEQRAIAAYVLQYGPRTPRETKIIVDALQFALQDMDDTVRNNAVRALAAIAVGNKLHPEQKIQIQATWFIELMNSVVWSDRHNASVTLVDLTEARDAGTLALLRERALASVVEMARWHELEHALPAFILAGRLAGLDEDQIKTAWSSGAREAVIKKALKPDKEKKS